MSAWSEQHGDAYGRVKKILRNSSLRRWKSDTLIFDRRC